MSCFGWRRACTACGWPLTVRLRKFGLYVSAAITENIALACVLTGWNFFAPSAQRLPPGARVVGTMPAATAVHPCRGLNFATYSKLEADFMRRTWEEPIIDMCIRKM